MKTKKSISVFLVAAMMATYLPVIPARAKEKITIAVYELTAKEVSAGMVSILSDVLRDAIFQTGMFEMLTKEDMKRIMENMAERQQVEPDCSTDACIAEIAGALGVEMMITGSVGKVGKTYVINLRLISAEMANTINTTSLSCPCEEDVLIERIKDAGLKLLKVEEARAERDAQAKKQAEAKRKAEEKARKKAEAERKKEEKRLKAAEAKRKKAEEKARKKAEAKRILEAESRKKERSESPPTAYKKKPNKALWWTVGLLLLGGGAAAAAAGGSSSSSSGGGGGGGSSDGGTTPAPSTGSITVSW